MELWTSICLYISFNIEVTASDKHLTEYWGAAIINLALQECLWSLGVQQMLQSFLLS